MKTGVELIAEERARQIEVEGWDAAHDDQHEESEMAHAARSYIQAAIFHSSTKPYSWPWDEWWKPSTDPIRNLAKAGALIAAEIDRIIRACPNPDTKVEP